MLANPILTSLWLFILLSFLAPLAWAAEKPATQPVEVSTLLPIPAELQKEIPPARSRAELAAVIGREKSRADALQRPPLHSEGMCKIVLLAGPKDHGPGEHDYPAWQKAWQRLLSKARLTEVITAWEKPSDDDLESADVLVIFKRAAWPKELNKRIDKLLARGGGIVLFHYAVDGADNSQHVGQNLGLSWGAGSKFRHGWLDLKFEDKKHDILRGLAGRTLRFHDESYWRLAGDPKRIEVLATAMEEDDGRRILVPLIWNREVGKGRVHVNILGHYNWTFNDPLFRVVALRGIAWAAGQPVDRFAELATVDVKLAEGK